MQTELVTKMIELHQQAGPAGAPIAQHLASLQEPETVINVIRDGWLQARSSVDHHVPIGADDRVAVARDS
ncbi:hypothetical protein [Streptomyces scopuliridis]|uniref:hypothetical protein n=1 Tax=Streptomyces scopuliridis TaxID=452529 RepID=UPI0035D63A0E